MIGASPDHGESRCVNSETPFRSHWDASWQVRSPEHWARANSIWRSRLVQDVPGADRQPDAARPGAVAARRDAATTSRMMSRVRSKDSKPELALRRALHRRGLRYRLHARDVMG